MQEHSMDIFPNITDLRVNTEPTEQIILTVDSFTVLV